MIVFPVLAGEDPAAFAQTSPQVGDCGRHGAEHTKRTSKVRRVGFDMAVDKAADELAMGSRAFTGIARAVWHVSGDMEQPGRRLFLPGKMNIAKQSTGLAFSIIGDPVGRVQWDPEPLDLTADDALAVESPQEHRRPGPEPEARNKAIAWLATLLAKGPVRVGDEKALEANTVAYAARIAGHSWATVRRAEKELGIESYRESFGGGWMWRLPKTSTIGAHVPPEHNNLSALGEPERLGAVQEGAGPLAVEGAQDAQVIQHGLAKAAGDGDGCECEMKDTPAAMPRGPPEDLSDGLTDGLRVRNGDMLEQVK